MTNNIDFVHKALHRLRKVLLNPKLSILRVKIQNFKMFRRENPCRQKFFGKLFHQNFCFSLAPRSTKNNCTDTPPGFGDKHVVEKKSRKVSCFLRKKTLKRRYRNKRDFIASFSPLLLLKVSEPTCSFEISMNQRFALSEKTK